MAEQDNQQEQPKRPTTVNTFTGGMVKDPLDLFKKDNTYTHARNMTNYLSDGGAGGKSGEPSNIASAAAPYTIIGCIYLSDDQWIIFSTNNTNSEIGLFINATNTYSTLMNDVATIAADLPGLNFNTGNLITGVARRGFECGFDVYWSDGQRNPDRTVNTAILPFTVTAKVYPNPWIQNCTTSAGCISCVNTNKIDIEQMRLAPLFSTPCIKLSRHQGSGQLANGSYQVCVAYAVNGVKCTDYIAFSNVYSTFTHLNNGGSIDITISNIDNLTKIRFTELEVVVVSMVNEQIEAKRLGIYSTSQGIINLSLIDKTLPNIPIEKLPISSPAIVSSDAIFAISNYLTRVGPKERPDFNYQPLANQIRANWVAVEYPEDYYHAGGDNVGMNVGYLRGETYAFYIRWVYSTGDKSADYPIPGLPGGILPTISIGGPSTGDSGTTLYSGRFAGYSSTETYPNTTPAVWGSLCGARIMHHKFPDQADGFGISLSHFNPNGKPPLGQKSSISVMGVYFDNIKVPIDNNGNVIRDIVGYEILRAVRDGHESILAKGMVNNMRTYTSYNGGPVDGLFQNYPYNDLNPDYFLTSNISNINNGATGNGANSPLTGFREDILSFHSPDTVFSHPFLGEGQLNIVMALQGVSRGKFTQPYKHPMFKVMSDFDSYLSDIFTAIEIGVVAAEVLSVIGGNTPDITLGASEALPMKIPLFATNDYTTDIEATDISVATKIATAIINSVLFLFLVPFQLKVLKEQFLTVVKGLIPARQFALQYNSFGYYDTPFPTGRIRGNIYDYMYIKGQMQSFAGFTINNLYRNDYVAIKCDSIPARQGDQSRYNVGPTTNPELNVWHTDHNGIPNNLDSYYGAYTVAQTAQYGQVDSTKQVPIGCVQQVDVLAASAAGSTFTSPVLFGGDTYINRYTEKNPMMFFNDWLINAPEDFKYDYRNYINVPYPMFWLNNDVVTYDLLGDAHQNRRLDGPMNMTLFYVKQGYFYLFNNGIRDFFVESSVNVGYRDWEDEVPKMFYDPYGSSDDFINEYFRSDIIKSSILYKYDYSLSANRFINQYVSWGKCLRRDYDPQLAYTCFAYYPRRVAYSLPQEEEQISDNWKIFLPNNYKPFNDKVTVIKDLHKTGAIFLMESTSPFMFAGVETIPSKSSTEYTVGTGKLFEQTLQSCGNVDDSYEFGSSQSRMGVVNTPHGIFWISQTAGKLFTLRENRPFDIGQAAGLKYWLLQYLPSQIVKQFPAYQPTDNPVAGVGCQLMYDSSNEVMYIAKKDFKLRDEFVGTVFWDPTYGFYTTDGIYRCPSGYTLSGTSCIISAPATELDYPVQATGGDTRIAGKKGLALFNPGYTVGGIGSNTRLSNSFWDSIVQSIGVWDIAQDPINVFIGFIYCFNAPTDGTYYIAVAVDDLFKIQMDGTDIVNIGTLPGAIAFTTQFGGGFASTSSATFELFNIFPITLTAGPHVLGVQALNIGGPGLVSMEIYNNTSSEILSATSRSDLNIMFTTLGMTVFRNAPVCPAGYNTTPGPTPCDTPLCQNIIPAVLDRFPVPDSYFEDASWTLSYDCRKNEFISFHDWHPSLNIPSRNHFLTIVDNQLWIHNSTVQSFCNFYGQDYPCEIEYFTNSQTIETVLQSVELLLESYQYAPNGFDKFLNYDEGFDQIMISNREQNSTLQSMQLKQWDDPYAALAFPNFIGPVRNILYQKVENKYRVNDFYDYTNDRGQFSLANVPMITTDPNGYTFTTNTAYFNLLKAWNQKKKFRYTGSRIFLRKTNLGKNSLTLRYADTKQQYSPR